MIAVLAAVILVILACITLAAVVRSTEKHAAVINPKDVQAKLYEKPKVVQRRY